ncbi:hypothetical protein [Cryobacterium sp. TMT3-29-2]|uniref:hypothetical protein n=1 Tax=Cryobacterium sp. TMT3-29-2 TaxID=2555867 RepID=UPI00107335E3|nr:hypothetical protein [Cryobacterium sp. TMT3-29-2]TFC87142.1 hypothetical protein E3O67_09715 [Cryobacterium sp. TMT3-29-2]
MKNIKQNTDGYIRMNARGDDSASVAISFRDGQRVVFSGRKLNKIFDKQLAKYQAESYMDDQGLVRGPTNVLRPKNNIMFVRVHPRMA